MKLRKIYNEYVRNNLFVKIILVFALIVNATIVSLSYMFFYFLSGNVVNNELQKQREAMDRIDRYMEQKNEWVQSAVQEIYSNSVLGEHVTYLLKHPYEDYIKYTLNESFAAKASGGTNAIEYFASKLEADPDIENVILYSSDLQQMYVYQAGAQPKLVSANAATSYIPDAMAMEGQSASTPNLWVRKAINQWNPKLYSIRVRINDRNSLQNIGQLTVYYDSEMIRRSFAKQDRGTFKGTILALTPDGQVLFDSSGRYYGKPYPYMDKISSGNATELLDEPSYVSALAPSAAGFLVVGVSPKSEIAKAYAGLKKTILFISAVCILFAIVIPSLVVVNISKRTNNIVRFMRKVEGGEMTLRLSDQREDELGQISRSFNEMLDELNRHIEREYKAEIERKQSELAALQARVNPHFLYNTLEAIRMRAMSQGADDVGQMLYSLAALFRNVVRNNPECTLREELEMCRLYLELFRIRYKDNFSYRVESSPLLHSVRVQKLILQPIVENYIVHGLDPQRADNKISIETKRESGIVSIRIEDNGSGIEPDKLRDIRRAMELPEAQDGESFGLRSVHERLKLVYGAGAGVRMESVHGSGTAVTVVFPDGEGAGIRDV